LVFSVAYNAVAVGLAAAGHMSPLLAAVLMPASSLVSLALVGADGVLKLQNRAVEVLVCCEIQTALHEAGILFLGRPHAGREKNSRKYEKTNESD
jgi:hypothetical protein